VSVTSQRLFDAVVFKTAEITTTLKYTPTLGRCGKRGSQNRTRYFAKSIDILDLITFCFFNLALGVVRILSNLLHF
jgi:hypothetical protein